MIKVETKRSYFLSFQVLPYVSRCVSTEAPLLSGLFNSAPLRMRCGVFCLLYLAPFSAWRLARHRKLGSKTCFLSFVGCHSGPLLFWLDKCLILFIFLINKLKLFIFVSTSMRLLLLNLKGKERDLGFDPCSLTYYVNGEYILIGGSGKKVCQRKKN